MARITRKTKRYPSDLTEEEWERIAPLMPEPGRTGRPREIEFREVIEPPRVYRRVFGSIVRLNRPGFTGEFLVQ
jgi:transposase